LKFALSRLISLNFASLLDKISAQQASKDTSTEAHTHQNTKNNQNTSKTLQKHHFNNKNNYLPAIFRSKPSTQARLAKNSPQLHHFNPNPAFVCSLRKTSHKIAISQRI